MSTQYADYIAERDAPDAAKVDALAVPIVRARFCPRFGGRYMLYKRDTQSPTGVMLETMVVDGPLVNAALNRKRISPLSPTERNF